MKNIKQRKRHLSGVIHVRIRFSAQVSINRQSKNDFFFTFIIFNGRHIKRAFVRQQ